MTIMLMVMSGMDTHTIRLTWIGMVGRWGFGQYGVLGQATIVDSMVG
jgi:hypothetical protein